MSGCGPADPKVRTRINPLSLENYRAKPPRIHIGPRRTQGRGGLVGKPMRSYLFDGMKPPEMSRQKFDGF